MGSPSQSQQRAERPWGLPHWHTAPSGQCQPFALCKGMALGVRSWSCSVVRWWFVKRKILHALKRCTYNICVCKGLPDRNSNELQGVWHKWALFWVLKTCNAVLSWLSQKPPHNMSLNVMNRGRAEHDLKHQGSWKEYTVSVYQQGIFKANIWSHLLPSHFHDLLTASLVRCIPGDISGIFFFLLPFLRASVMLIC